jgi:hypothetical protein
VTLRIKPARNLVAVMSAVVLLAGSSSALCGSPRPRLACAEFFQEQAVVTAKLISARHVLPKNEDRDDYDLYTMETTQILRGTLPQRFRVIQENNSGRTGIAWYPGESYLLFLSYSPEHKAWSLDGCSNSDRLSESEKVLQEIQQLRAQPGSGGTIQGLVWPASEATVLVRAMHGSFKTATKTNEEGGFKVHVPAGRYTVWPVHKGQQFEVDLLSYENPRKIKIANGGCAQVQFNVREK